MPAPFKWGLWLSVLTGVALSAVAVARTPPWKTQGRSRPAGRQVTVDSVSPARVSFTVRFRDEETSYRVGMLTVLPGRTVRLHADGRDPAEPFDVIVAGGTLQQLAPGSWEWTAPAESRHLELRIVRRLPADTMLFNVFVLVPFSAIEHGELNGYRIGTYPERPLRRLAVYRRPRGFVEVTPENENTLVSPHFRLRQFVCKQAAGHPKYVVLSERLILKLEYLLERVNEAGHPAATFNVLSGYRTPYYNAAIGNVRYSGHVYGMAADIFVDEDGDDLMDDLNGDGRHDVQDAQVLYALVDSQVEDDEYADYIGGLGRYRRTAAHGPFVHVDVRGFRARW